MTELGEEAEAGIRYGPLSGAMESVIKAKALAHFLRTGALLRRSDVCWASYDEFIPGVIAFANELQRYVGSSSLKACHMHRGMLQPPVLGVQCRIVVCCVCRRMARSSCRVVL